MKNKDLLPVRNYIGFFFLCITIVLISKIVFSMFAIGFIDAVWDLNSIEIFNDLTTKKFSFIYAHKALAFFDQIGTFLIPSFIFLILIKSFSIKYRTVKRTDFIKLSLYFVILLSITQLLFLFTDFIGIDFLPLEVSKFLENQQEFNTKLQEGFITSNYPGFLFNILLLAIIPAVGEELFFRGILQKLCIGIFKNNIIGIIITSFLFGVLHFQIDNLLSIIFASILLGLIYDYSNNLLLTIILHFAFNLFALLSMQAIKINLISEIQLESIVNYVIIPAGVIIGIIVLAKRIFWKKELLLSVD